MNEGAGGGRDSDCLTVCICRVPEVDPYQSTIGTAMLYQKSIDFWYSYYLYQKLIEFWYSYYLYQKSIEFWYSIKLYQKSIDFWYSIAVPIVDWDNHSFMRVMYQNSICTKSRL